MTEKEFKQLLSKIPREMILSLNEKNMALSSNENSNKNISLKRAEQIIRNIKKEIMEKRNEK